jgi:hypothetical protein
MKVSAQSARKNVVPALVLLEAWEESDETGVSSRTSLVNHLRSSRLSIAPNGWKRGREKEKEMYPCEHVPNPFNIDKYFSSSNVRCRVYPHLIGSHQRLLIDCALLWNPPAFVALRPPEPNPTCPDQTRPAINLHELMTPTC